jgi:hypothetical protein
MGDGHHGPVTLTTACSCSGEPWTWTRLVSSGRRTPRRTGSAGSPSTRTPWRFFEPCWHDARRGRSLSASRGHQMSTCFSGRGWRTAAGAGHGDPAVRADGRAARDRQHAPFAAPLLRDGALPVSRPVWMSVRWPVVLVMVGEAPRHCWSMRRGWPRRTSAQPSYESAAELRGGTFACSRRLARSGTPVTDPCGCGRPMLGVC